MSRVVQSYFGEDGTVKIKQASCCWCGRNIDGPIILCPPTWVPSKPGEASTYCSPACAWHHHPEKFPEIVDCEVPNCSLHKTSGPRRSKREVEDSVKMRRRRKRKEEEKDVGVWESPGRTLP